VSLARSRGVIGAGRAIAGITCVDEMPLVLEKARYSNISTRTQLRPNQMCKRLRTLPVPHHLLVRGVVRVLSEMISQLITMSGQAAERKIAESC
jgi:hypothetical protein